MIQTFNAIIDMDLTSNEKSLLLAILRHVNHQTGECYPSVETLMKKSGIKSKTTFLKVRKNLVEKGLLQYNQKGTKLYYMITIEPVQNFNEPVQNLSKGGSTVDYEQVFNKKEQKILITESNPYFDYLNGGWMYEMSNDMIH